MTIECADTFRLASRSWPRVPLVWSWRRVSPLKFVHLLRIRSTCNGRSVFRALLFRISCVLCVVCLVSRVSLLRDGWSSRNVTSTGTIATKFFEICNRCASRRLRCRSAYRDSSFCIILHNSRISISYVTIN